MTMSMRSVKSHHDFRPRGTPHLLSVSPVFVMGLLLLFGGRHDGTSPGPLESGFPRTPSMRQHTIWPELMSPPPLPGYFLLLREGNMVMRRFQSPANGSLLHGAFYVMASDQLRRDVIVSVCADRDGRPDDTVRLGSARTTARVPVVAASVRDADDQGAFREHAYPVGFSVECRLEAGSWYWLVLEPTWIEEPAPEFYVDGYAYRRYLALLSPVHSTRDTMVHIPLPRAPNDWGVKLSYWPDCPEELQDRPRDWPVLGLVAELQSLEIADDESTRQ